MRTNFLFFLQAYSDSCQTSTPALSNFQWSRQISGVPYILENSQQIQVTASTTTSNILPYTFATPKAIPVQGYTFTVTSANATVGATYTNNTHTFTVLNTITAGTTLYATGTGAPTSSGTLTLATGTGDATITFSAFIAGPTITIGTNTITGVIPTSGLVVGDLIVGTGIPVGTTVESITGTTVTMSQNATSSGVETITFYGPASFIYLESDQQVSVIYNNGSPMAINPFEINGRTVPGVFFMNGPAYSLTVTNPGTVTANIFFASMG